MDEITQSLIRRLARGETAPASSDLLSILNEFGVHFDLEGDNIRLQAPLELLDANVIRGFLDDAALHKLSQLEIFWSIDSTNTYLMNRADSTGFYGRVCLAEQQLAGKGRRGRHWVSPFATNIALSIGWEVPREVSGVGGISLVVGMAVVEVLRNAGLKETGLKWPNDVIYEGGKLCGILLEMAPVKGGKHRIVIGIGVNLAIDVRAAEGIDQHFSTAGDVMKTGRNQLVAELVNRLVSELSNFETRGFSGYAELWSQYDLYNGQIVEVRMADSVQHGKNCGVDPDGNLLLQTDAGMKSYNAGEVSLRPTNK